MTRKKCVEEVLGYRVSSGFSTQCESKEDGLEGISMTMSLCGFEQ